MLVLSRKNGESVLIGEDIEVTITEIRGDKVRIGVKAPKEIKIHRKEVAELIAKNKLKEESSPATESATNP